MPLIIVAAIVAAMKLMQGFMQSTQLKSAGNAAHEAGVNQQLIANAQAQRLNQQANAEAASAQRKAVEQRREGNLIRSRTQALAAASGADVSSPGIVNNMGDIEAEASYRSSVALYEGQTAESNLNYQADLERNQGLNARIAGRAQKHIAYAQANQKLLSSFIDAGGTFASMMAGGAGGAAGAAAGSQQFQSQIGSGQAGFGSGTILQQQMNSGSPLFAAYGSGGVGASKYP